LFNKKNLEKKVITGVAAGLSDSLGLNVYLFRARFFVVALLTKGLGVIPYILMGLLLPMR
jgi:phage shock protein PspC (stress-responsive transcriptional regulator)